MRTTRIERGVWPRVVLATCGAVAVLLGGRSIAGAPAAVPGFGGTEVMVPMRDGVKLHTIIYAPSAAKDRLPILFLRTPYGIDSRSAMLQTSLKELADDGYLFVLQDIRGKFGSEGTFAMIRPPRDPADPKAIDEGTDAYDSIDWMVKNVPGQNGRVGMLGVSYDGWLTVMALLAPHPALRAASPQASPADMFLGDDFHHNGAFRLSYGLEYVARMETVKGMQFFQFDRHDTFEWFLALGPLSSANARYFHGKLPTWNDFVNHPNYDAFWQKQAVARFLTRPSVPTLNVAGWWDQEDFYGPLRIYETWEKEDSRSWNTIVVGPWNHGGWSRGPGDRLGPIRFDVPTALQFREKIQVPFFAHYLKDRALELDPAFGRPPSKSGPGAAGSGGLPEVISFRTGANQWNSYDQWPPPGVTPRRLYLRAEGRLAFEPPDGIESQAQAGAGEGNPDRPAAFDRYVSDPARPVPYHPRPIAPLYTSQQWPEWLVQDQRFVHLRPDVLSYESEPLNADLDIIGPIEARLFAATSGTDCDWIVKLIDVYPEAPPGPLAGYQLMVANEVFRSRFRHGFERPEPLVPDQVESYTVDLHWADHRFRKGHKLMVQIQSTWFPLIDRNPQKFVANIFEAKATDYTAATQRVYRTPGRATHLRLHVIAH